MPPGAFVLLSVKQNMTRVTKWPRKQSHSRGLGLQYRGNCGLYISSVALKSPRLSSHMIRTQENNAVIDTILSSWYKATSIAGAVFWPGGVARIDMRRQGEFSDSRVAHCCVVVYSQCGTTSSYVVRNFYSKFLHSLSGRMSLSCDHG